MAATSERVTSNGHGTEEWRDYVQVGPGTLPGRYLRRFWHPLYLSDDLAPGRTKPIRILGEDFTLYRGESGAAHVVAFRCAHRGTQLSTGWVEGDEIRCFYHGWKYDGAGQCTEQPAEPEPFCQRIKIRSYPTQEYLGLIWAYLGEGEPPPFRRFPQLEAESDSAIRVTRGGWILPYSYANVFENDPAHVPFVHRGGDFFEDIPLVSSQETEYGTKETVTFKSRVGYVHRILPYGRMFVVPVMEVAKGGWVEMLIMDVPVDDDRHVEYAIALNHLTLEAVEPFRERVRQGALNWYGAPPSIEAAAKVLRGEARIEDFGPRQDLVAVQDITSQGGQGPIRDRINERLGRSDAGLIELRRVWERELRNLAEGRPLKEWTIPERIELTANYHG
jgi:5,5'-dehydrodivanillate O-demethylase